MKTTIAALLLAATTAFAGTNTFDRFNIDAFGSYRPRTGVWGEGVGVSYFPLTWVGAGLEGQFDGIHGVFTRDANVAGNLIFRLPKPDIGSDAPTFDRLRNILQPYAFVGGGRPLGPSVWEVHAGAGLEWQWFKNFGVFGDHRVIFDPDEIGKNWHEQQSRLGVRFKF